MTLEFSRVTLAAPLWTVAEVKVHLQITDTAHDGDVSQKLDAAQERILAYLGAAADPAWTPGTAPRAVMLGVLLLTAHYYEHRGDDLGPTSPDEAIIWRELEHLLSLYRDPGMA